MYNVHVWHDCRRIQYTPSPSLEIILPVKLFVLFGYPLSVYPHIRTLSVHHLGIPISCSEGKTLVI